MAQEPRTAQERALDLLRATLATTSWLPDTPAKRLVWTIRCAIVLGVLVLIASAVDKTLWNWLDLLIIPVVLAIGGYWFNSQQQSREFAIAEQRSQDETLQAYLDQMAPLLTDEERPLRRARPGEDLSVVAWAWTKTVLRRMGRVHKGNVLRFVNEAGLINKHSPVFHLSGADLHGADLRSSTLTDANLHGADLSEADLCRADLRGADLSEAKLNGAILIKARLGTARVSVALPDGGAESAEPYPADLRRADLSQANLQCAQGCTHEQLDQAQSLEGATMPDGMQYEDWVERGWLRQRNGKDAGRMGEKGSPCNS